MKWTEYTISAATSQEERIEKVLDDAGFDSFMLSDDVPLSAEDEKRMFTDIPAEIPESGKAVFTVYSTEDESAPEVFSTGSSIRDKDPEETYLIKSAGETMSLLNGLFDKEYADDPENRPEISFSIRDDSEWKDKYKETFRAFRVTPDIIIKPVWEERPDFAEKGDTVVTINPGAGFGTGMHDTTKLCITALEKYMKRGARVFDIGCGSGILGITSLLKGASFAALMDIDELAVDNVMEDMAENGIDSEHFRAFRGDVLSDEKQVIENVKDINGGKFDVVFANILADVIIPLSARVPQYMEKDGIFIVSGVLNERSDEVTDALIKNGFRIIETNTGGEWTCIISCRS